MRPRTALELLSALLTTGCLVPPHDSFATPRDAVLTFQSAFARDDEFKEYDCFARAMKMEQEPRLTQQTWSLARGQLFEPLGGFGRFVLRRNSLADNEIASGADGRVARIYYEIAGQGLAVSLLPELRVRLLDLGGESLAEVPVLRIGSSMLDDDGGANDPGKPIPMTLEGEIAHAAFEQLVHTATIVLTRDWKLQAISATTAAAATAATAEPLEPLEPLPTPQPPVQECWFPEDPVPVRRLREELGVVRIALDLMVDLETWVELQHGPFALNRDVVWTLAAARTASAGSTAADPDDDVPER